MHTNAATGTASADHAEIEITTATKQQNVMHYANPLSPNHELQQTTNRNPYPPCGRQLQPKPAHTGHHRHLRIRSRHRLRHRNASIRLWILTTITKPMQITIEIPDHAAEAVVSTLQAIIAQLKPEEHICLGVNGLYWTASNQMAHCVDIYYGFFICEINGEKYPFFECGDPAQLPAFKTYPHKIVLKIKR